MRNEKTNQTVSGDQNAGRSETPIADRAKNNIGIKRPLDCSVTWEREELDRGKKELWPFQYHDAPEQEAR